MKFTLYKFSAVLFLLILFPLLNVLNAQKKDDYFPVIRTRTGQVYSNAYVDRIYSDSILITHKKGSKQINRADLPAEVVQKIFGGSARERVVDFETRLQEDYENSSMLKLRPQLEMLSNRRKQ